MILNSSYIAIQVDISERKSVVFYYIIRQFITYIVFYYIIRQFITYNESTSRHGKAGKLRPAGFSGKDRSVRGGGMWWNAGISTKAVVDRFSSGLPEKSALDALKPGDYLRVALPSGEFFWVQLVARYGRRLEVRAMDRLPCGDVGFGDEFSTSTRAVFCVL